MPKAKRTTESSLSPKAQKKEVTPARVPPSKLKAEITPTKAEATPTESKAGITPTKSEATPKVAEDLAEYINRFREREARNSSNARGGGAQTVTDATIMRNLCAIASGDEPNSCGALRMFAIAYGVSRTFPGLSEHNVAFLTPIVEHLKERWPTLQGIRRAPSEDDISREVDALADVCQRVVGRANLSFASKCLNMLGLPVPIFSSEGKAYLGFKWKKSDVLSEYASFCRLWFASYAEQQPQYEAHAAKQIRRDDELEARLGPKWFAMRGFDVTLMRVGGPMRK